MKTRAAVLFEPGAEWEIVEIDLDRPKAGEVRVQFKAAGLCHSDEHMRQAPAVPPEVAGTNGLHPMVGGHEGAGIVLEVGPGVTTVAPGDHVAVSFMPTCGKCRWCVSGRGNLCNNGGRVMLMGMMSDGTSRHHFNGTDLNPIMNLGTWSGHGVVDEASLLKIDKDLPFGPMALVGCGATTGSGSAMIRGDVRPGQTVVIVGCGGVGSNAVQGAHLAGARHIIAVDPVAMKRDVALTLGATHVAESMDAAFPIVQELTIGEMAETVILTPGELERDMIAPALALTAKDGTVIVTGMSSNLGIQEVPISLFELTMWQKSIRGALFGGGDPRTAMPNLISLYQAGRFKLDELITRVYPLDEVNKATRDLLNGEVIRAVFSMD
jgi:NDMA-dependent alcohol dehydrogenase